MMVEINVLLEGGGVDEEELRNEKQSITEFNLNVQICIDSHTALSSIHHKTPVSPPC